MNNPTQPHDLIERIMKKIQIDLDYGKFNVICSNESNFKDYVEFKLHEAYELGRIAGVKEVEEIIDSTLITDFPTAWRMLATKKDNHHEKCSWRVAGLLCDCAGEDVFDTTIKFLKEKIKSSITKLITQTKRNYFFL